MNSDTVAAGCFFAFIGGCSAVPFVDDIGLLGLALITLAGGVLGALLTEARS